MRNPRHDARPGARGGAHGEVATERLDALRERFGTLVGVDRPAAEGDFVVLDLKAEIDGEEVDSVSGVLE